MTWRIEFERPALREFEKLSYPERARILAFLTQRLAVRADIANSGNRSKARGWASSGATASAIIGSSLG